MQTVNISIHYEFSAFCKPNNRPWLTVVRYQAPMVFNVEIWEGAMDVSAYFLPRLRGAEDSDNRDLRGISLLWLISPSGQSGVKSGGQSLVVIDTVEPDAEDVHRGS